MYDVPSIDPPELRSRLAGDRPPVLVDVREAEELEISRLPGAIHIPLHELPTRIGELNPEWDIVTICRVGGRSGHAAAFLIHHGFGKVTNLAMGMNGWARLVDPTLPEY
jgi:rhodanese-related sulfurtransferase